MVNRIGVVGAGNMGSAIAEVLAFNGYEVVLKDINLELTARGIERIGKILSSNVSFQESRAKKEITRIEKTGITLSDDQKAVIEKNLAPSFTMEDSKKVLSRITQSENYSDFNSCDLVIEAAFEKEEIKKEVFKGVSEEVSEDTVIASNTSSLSISSLAPFTHKPENVIITHFFNPPFTLPLVEIVRALQTSDETEKKILEFISGLKNHRGPMVPIKVKEVPGFLVNRILVPVMNEAAMILDEGVATKEDIDTAMKLGAGFPMGPLELSDMVGLDIVLDVQEILNSKYGDPKYRPSPLLRRMVDAGKLGRKSKEGYYLH